MRLMYDSVNANAIPTDAEMVAGYIDGTSFRWSDLDWNRFPNAIKVRIARRTFTDDGHVLDVESGIPTVWPLTDPAIQTGIVNWVKMRRNAGIEPTIYCNQLNDWQPIRQIFQNARVPEPLWWVARYNNVRDIPQGAVAKQFANPPLAGGHYDLSMVADYWPGVDNQPEENNMRDLILGQEESGKVWVGNGMTRRHVADEAELSGLQYWIGQKGGDPTLHQFQDLRVLGIDLATLVPQPPADITFVPNGSITLTVQEEV